MLFATDKFTLSFGDTAKLTIQYENTTLTNTGKKQAIVEASKDGYTWAQVASIAPESSLPLKIEALYVRLTTDTTISVVNTNPIPRDAKKSDIAVNINTEALVIKNDLQAYVSKNELNDLVHHPDLSGFVTKAQVRQMIPEIPTPPDITGLASKESVELKADQTDVDGLKLTIATKADTTAMAALETTVTESVIPAITHLNTIKADKTELNTLAEQVAQSKATVGTLATQVTGFQSALDDRVTKKQAEDANRVLLNAIAARATTEQLNVLHDEVEQKANQQQVDELVNKAFHLEQDKANKAELIELTKTITLLESIISGNADPTLLEDIKTDLLAKINPELPALVEQVLTDTGTTETLEQIKAAINGLYSDKAESVHTHQMTDIDGLQAALNGKAPTSHSHSWSSINGKPTTFAPSTHTHGITDVSGLQAALDAKAPATHSHAVNWEDISGKPTDFNPSTHTHSIANVTGLQAALDAKAPNNHSHTVSWNTLTDRPASYPPASHTHTWSQLTGVPTSSIAQAGIVQLNNTLTSTAVNQALTAAQGKVLNDALKTKASSDHQHQWEDISTYQAPKPVNLITSVDTIREGDISPEYPYISYAQLHPNMHIEAGEQFTLTVWAELGSTHTGLTLVFLEQRTGNPLITIPLTKISQGVYQYKGNLDPLITPPTNEQYNAGTFYIGYTGTRGSTTTVIKVQLTRGTQAYEYRPHPSVMTATLKDLNTPNLVPKEIMQQFVDDMYYSGQYGQLGVTVYSNLPSSSPVIYPAGKYTVTVWGKINQPLYLGVHGNSPQGLSHSTSFSYTGREYVHIEDQRFVEISPNIYAATIELPELIINSFYIEMQSLARTREWQNQYQLQQQAGTVPPNAFYFDAIQIKQENRASDYSPHPKSFFTNVIPSASSSQAGLVKVVNSLTSVSNTDALSAAQGRHITQQFTYREYASHLLGAKVMRNIFSKLTVMTIRADCTTNKVINLPEAFSDTTYFWIARGESTKGWIKGTTTSTSRITLDSTDNPDATGIINILVIGYKA